MSDTVYDLARQVMPNASDEECDRLLWECSPFPFADAETVLATMRKTWEAGGQTLEGAIAYSYAELHRAMDEFAKREEVAAIADRGAG